MKLLNLWSFWGKYVKMKICKLPEEMCKIFKLSWKMWKYENMPTSRGNVKILKYANFQGKCKSISFMRISREICGLFFPLSSFSSALPSPSPPFSGQVSLQIWEWFCCCSKAWEWNVDEERFSNHPKSKLSPMPRQSVIQQALQLHRVIIRNSKISSMPLRSDLLHTCHKKLTWEHGSWAYFHIQKIVPTLRDDIHDCNRVTSACGLNIRVILRFTNHNLMIKYLLQAKPNCVVGNIWFQWLVDALLLSLFAR